MTKKKCIHSECKYFVPIKAQDGTKYEGCKICGKTRLVWDMKDDECPYKDSDYIMTHEDSILII